MPSIFVYFHWEFLLYFFIPPCHPGWYEERWLIAGVVFYMWRQRSLVQKCRNFLSRQVWHKTSSSSFYSMFCIFFIGKLLCHDFTTVTRCESLCKIHMLLQKMHWWVLVFFDETKTLCKKICYLFWQAEAFAFLSSKIRVSMLYVLNSQGDAVYYTSPPSPFWFSLCT